MILYRALPKDNIRFGEDLIRYSTPRLPSNVPYFVDNLWEYFRPDDKPSRRFAVYASPSPELALKNATNIGFLNNDDYQACIVEPKKALKTMQLSVKDAREHKDIRKIQKLVHEHYYNSSLEQRKMLAIIFCPGVQKSDLVREISINVELNKFMAIVEPLVTIWQDTPSAEGELFFEIDEGNSYQLKEII